MVRIMKMYDGLLALFALTIFCVIVGASRSQSLYGQPNTREKYAVVDISDLEQRGTLPETLAGILVVSTSPIDVNRFMLNDTVIGLSHLYFSTSLIFGSASVNSMPYLEEKLIDLNKGVALSPWKISQRPVQECESDESCAGVTWMSGEAYLSREPEPFLARVWPRGDPLWKARTAMKQKDIFQGVPMTLNDVFPKRVGIYMTLPEMEMPLLRDFAVEYSSLNTLPLLLVCPPNHPHDFRTLVELIMRDSKKSQIEVVWPDEDSSMVGVVNSQYTPLAL